jgi:hypothetical protein
LSSSRETGLAISRPRFSHQYYYCNLFVVHDTRALGTHQVFAPAHSYVNGLCEIREMGNWHRAFACCAQEPTTIAFPYMAQLPILPIPSSGRAFNG